MFSLFQREVRVHPVEKGQDQNLKAVVDQVLGGVPGHGLEVAGEEVDPGQDVDLDHAADLLAGQGRLLQEDVDQDQGGCI